LTHSFILIIVSNTTGMAHLQIKCSLQGLPVQSPGCDFGAVHVECVIEWHQDRVFLKYFGLLLSVSLHHCSILIFIYMLLSPERQKGGAWKPPKNQCYFGKRGVLDSEILFNH